MKIKDFINKRCDLKQIKHDQHHKLWSYKQSDGDSNDPQISLPFLDYEKSMINKEQVINKISSENF